MFTGLCAFLSDAAWFKKASEGFSKAFVWLLKGSWDLASKVISRL